MHNKHSSAEVLFAQKLIEEINSNAINTPKELEERRFFWSKKLKLSEMPSFPFVLSCTKNASLKVRNLLSIKPTRSLSGVQVIAVMLPPFPCPGKCTYCPSSLEGNISPKSYTGFEPSALRAQRLNYDPYEIVSNRIKQLDLTGNTAEKIELIFQGSSFTALPKRKQENVVLKSLNAITQKKTNSIVSAKRFAESSKRRVVGITFETRPDLCSKKDVKEMLFLGGTRVELGVQNPSDEIYKRINRGHSVRDVVDSTKLLKDSAFKVLYHLMPGLPGSNYKIDLANFKKIFSDSNFMPDMVKFYPCLVIKGTKLYEDWKKGDYVPLTEDDAIKLLVEIKSFLPKWVRVMRVDRDIPSNVIEAGVKRTNLRQLVEKELELQRKKCNCIRCREIGLGMRFKPHDFSFEEELSKAKLNTEFYDASMGEEAFISFESKNHLFGFVRLRKPQDPFVFGLTKKTALIRELHVYGKSLSLGEKDSLAAQHQGLGKELMNEAQKIAKERFDSKRMAVISGLGVREYYKKNFGFKKKEPYMVKTLK